MELVEEYDSVNIFGVSIYRITLKEVLKEIETALKRKVGLTYGALDPNKLNLAYENKDFRHLYRSFDIVAPDATGTLLAARILGKRLGGQRLPGDILAPRLFNLAKRTEINFYLLGAKRGIIKQAAKTLTCTYNWLNINGIHHGYFPTSGQENDRIVREIRDKGTDVVLVGMGSPKQEKWIVENSPRLPETVLITMGGYFDMIVDNVECYPPWVYKYKLNWLYRCFKEPVRLGPRYLIGIPKFFSRVLKQKRHGKKTYEVQGE